MSISPLRNLSWPRGDLFNENYRNHKQQEENRSAPIGLGGAGLFDMFVYRDQRMSKDRLSGQDSD